MKCKACDRGLAVYGTRCAECRNAAVDRVQIPPLDIHACRARRMVKLAIVFDGSVGFALSQIGQEPKQPSFSKQEM